MMSATLPQLQGYRKQSDLQKGCVSMALKYIQVGVNETNVRAVLISACETWKGIKNTEYHLQVYINRWYLRKILYTKSPNAINK